MQVEIITGYHVESAISLVTEACDCECMTMLLHQAGVGRHTGRRIRRRARSKLAAAYKHYGPTNLIRIGYQSYSYAPDVHIPSRYAAASG